MQLAIVLLGETDGLETQELIGIAVGAGIVVVMIALCCILVVCALVSRGKCTYTI